MDSQNFNWKVSKLRVKLRKLGYVQMCVETKEQYQLRSDEELLQVEFYLRNGTSGGSRISLRDANLLFCQIFLKTA